MKSKNKGHPSIIIRMHSVDSIQYIMCITVYTYEYTRVCEKCKPIVPRLNLISRFLTPSGPILEHYSSSYSGSEMSHVSNMGTTLVVQNFHV